MKTINYRGFRIAEDGTAWRGGTTIYGDGVDDAKKRIDAWIGV